MSSKAGQARLARQPINSQLAILPQLAQPYLCDKHIPSCKGHNSWNNCAIHFKFLHATRNPCKWKFSTFRTSIAESVLISCLVLYTVAAVVIFCYCISSAIKVWDFQSALDPRTPVDTLCLRTLVVSSVYVCIVCVARWPSGAGLCLMIHGSWVRVPPLADEYCPIFFPCLPPPPLVHPAVNGYLA